MLVAALALAGCEASSPAGSGGRAGKGVLNIALDSDFAARGYDPLAYSVGQRQFFEALYDSLFVMSADGGVEPGLATTYRYNAKSTKLTLTLREGVRFTDGSTLTAQLVKKNLDRRSDRALVLYGAFARGGAAEIRSVKAPDPRTVVIRFATPQAGAHLQLGGQPGMIVGKRGIADPGTLAATPDGSGPYTLQADKTLKGSSYALTRNPRYWNTRVHPYDSVVFTPIHDPQARANALVSGQVDLAPLAGAHVPYVTSQGMREAKVGGTVMAMLVFDKLGKTSKPFGDVRVRQALQVAVDRRSLVDRLHKGSRATANAFARSLPGYDPGLDDAWAHDPARARRLLAEAGYPDGFSFTLVANQKTMTDMEAVQAQLATVGIRMQPTLAASTEEAFAAVATTPLGYGPLTWHDPVAFVQNDVVGGYMNVQKATDPDVQGALDAAAGAEGAERVAALTKLNGALVSRGWLIPLYEEYVYTGFNPERVEPVTFAGNDPFPLLSSIAPAA